jgi:hypothetical protein
MNANALTRCPQISRRQMLARCGTGFGMTALASLLDDAGGLGLRVAAADSATFRQSNEFGHGLHSHLLHHVGTMDLDRLLDSAEVAGNLFVLQAK